MLGGLGDRVDPGLMVVDLGLHRLVLLDQVLDANQVTTSIRRGHDGLLLTHPGLLVLDITEQLLHGQRVHEPLLPVVHGAGNAAVPLVEVGLLDLDVLGVKVAGLAELIRRDPHPVDAILVGCDVGLEKGVLLLQVLHGRQVLAVVLRHELALDLAEPELQVFDAPVVLLLLRGLLQLDALLLARVQQVLPQLGDLLQLGLDAIGVNVA